eukprot:COSAG02_NODE_52056_length_310_cov_0.772512_1_plen_72_part_10
MPPDRILPACVGAASRRYDDSRRPASRRVRARPLRAAGRPRERDRRTDRRNLEFARAAVRLLRDTDGNTVQR